MNWTSAGSTVTLGNIPSACYIGFALTSHDNAALAAAQFDHVTVIDSSLAAPTGLGAVVTNGTAASTTGSVALSWQAVSGATGYTVKRATVSGGPYTILAEGVASPNYTDTVAADGTTWYYVVSSTNEERASVDSSPVSGKVSSDFQQWKTANGLSVGIADTATPDNDGMSVLMKYALGISPGTPAAQPVGDQGSQRAAVELCPPQSRAGELHGGGFRRRALDMDTDCQPDARCGHMDRLRERAGDWLRRHAVRDDHGPAADERRDQSVPAPARGSLDAMSPRKLDFSNLQTHVILGPEAFLSP